MWLFTAAHPPETSAIQAARMGKRVAILEPGKHLGGMAVEGLGGTDIDNHKEFQNSLAVGGLALQSYKRIAKAYNRLDQFELALKNKQKDPSLCVLKAALLSGYTMNG